MQSRANALPWLALSAAMIVFGYLGYRDMGVSQFPEIDFPVVSIVITREAASPDIMDGDVTDIVEDAAAYAEANSFAQLDRQVLRQLADDLRSIPSSPEIGSS